MTSIAFALPTARVRRCVPPAPGMIPRPVSGWPNCAVSEATIRSQAIASSLPPPRQKPETAATSGRADAPDRVPAVDAARLVHLHRARLGHLADVRAGGEGALGAAEDDAADLLVVVQRGESVHELAHDLVVERVQRLGPVEQDDRDRRLALDEDDAHSPRSRNFSTAAFGSSVAIESASQSRAWLTVSCQARSRQKLSCCFV